MQEGAGVRQLLEDELRRQGRRLRDLRPSLVLGLQESVRSAVVAGYGVTFISRRAVEADLEREGLRKSGRGARSRARRSPSPAPPAASRAARPRRFSRLPRNASRDRPLGPRPARAAARGARDRAAVPRHERAVAGARSARCGDMDRDPVSPHRSSGRRRRRARGRWRQLDRHGQGGVGGHGPAARLGADHVLGRGVDADVRHSRPGQADGGRGRGGAADRHRLRAGAHPRAATARLRRYRHERPRPLCGGSLPRRSGRGTQGRGG